MVCYSVNELSVVAIALAEQKLTLEQLHKTAVEELQNKLKRDNELAYTELHRKFTHEKELAVAEAKKKQWVVLAMIDVRSSKYVALNHMPW